MLNLLKSFVFHENLLKSRENEIGLRLGTFVKNEAIAAFLDPYFHESGLKRLTIKSYGLSKLRHADLSFRGVSLFV